jgi:transcription-repair coupling factor (superfamily II helicase)
LLDFIGKRAMVVLCEPARLKERAEEYGAQVPEGDPFFLSWEKFQKSAVDQGMCLLHLAEAGSEEPGASAPSEMLSADLTFQSLEAFRPVTDRAVDPQIAEAQRREFFAQIHRWERQGHTVRIFCNNEGERQRFGEIWREYGLEPELAPSASIGVLSRGFVFQDARLVVITDAEIFGRYKVQRPRRLKSPHAQATRSALDIDFADLEEGDFVVHLQHGIGRYLGLSTLPLGPTNAPREPGATAGMPCYRIRAQGPGPAAAQALRAHYRGALGQ